MLSSSARSLKDKDEIHLFDANVRAKIAFNHKQSLTNRINFLKNNFEIVQKK